MTEERRVEFLAYPDGSRAIDVISLFGAGPGSPPIRLGDTKEAGLVAVRVAPALSASPVITASSGCAGEPHCWGKPAAWCDLAGPAQGPTYGVAVLAHPENPRFPVRWHVRAYGLLAANPFGLAAFDKAPPGTGDFLLDSRTGALFRHRVIVHRGSAAAAGIAAKYDEFAGTSNQPQIERADRLARLDWRIPDPNPWWTFDGGTITGRQDPERRGHVLESRQVFRDVLVELEYRYTGDVDSGVFLRAGRRWQCQIGISRSLRRDMTASIYDEQRKYVAEAREAPALNTPGAWHRLRIEARGDRFRHWLDGRLVLDYTDPAFTGEGPVGLQLHGGVADMRIEFRGVRVLNLADPSIMIR